MMRTGAGAWNGELTLENCWVLASDGWRKDPGREPGIGSGSLLAVGIGVVGGRWGPRTELQSPYDSTVRGQSDTDTNLTIPALSGGEKESARSENSRCCCLSAL